MMQVVITRARAVALEEDGYRRVTRDGVPLFLFVGPGPYLAALGYTDRLPSELGVPFAAVDSEAAWDTLEAYIEGETPQEKKEENIRKMFGKGNQQQQPAGQAQAEPLPRSGLAP